MSSMALVRCTCHFKSSKEREKWAKNAKCMGFVLFDGIKQRYIQLHPPIPDGFPWNKVCRCLWWSWIHVSTILNQPFVGSGAGETAASVYFDGPSVPSGKCCSSCPSTTGPISLLFVGTWSQLHPSKMPDQSFLQNFWGLPKWQGETPKRQQTSIWSSFGALPPMVEGWQSGEPF